MISNTKISTMSDDVVLYNDENNKYISTMSGDVDLTNCRVENIHTMSGDVRAVHTGIIQDIDTMSGDVLLEKCIAWDVHTMSGNITLHETEADTLDTMAGRVSCYHSKIGKISCIKVGRLDGSTIKKIYIKKETSKHIQCSGDICIDGDCIHISHLSPYNLFAEAIKNIFKKPKKKVIIELSKNSHVEEIEFEEEGIVKSYYDLKVINGALEKLN